MKRLPRWIRSVHGPGYARKPPPLRRYACFEGVAV